MSSEPNMKDCAVLIENLHFAEQLVSNIIAKNENARSREFVQPTKTLYSLDPSPARPAKERSSKENIALHRTLQAYGASSLCDSGSLGSRTFISRTDSNKSGSVMSSVNNSRKSSFNTTKLYGNNVTPTTIASADKFTKKPIRTNISKVSSATSKRTASSAPYKKPSNLKTSNQSAQSAHNSVFNNFQITTFDTSLDSGNNKESMNRPRSSGLTTNNARGYIRRNNNNHHTANNIYPPRSSNNHNINIITDVNSGAAFSAVDGDDDDDNYGHYYEDDDDYVDIDNDSCSTISYSPKYNYYPKTGTNAVTADTHHRQRRIMVQQQQQLQKQRPLSGHRNGWLSPDQKQHVIDSDNHNFMHTPNPNTSSNSNHHQHSGGLQNNDGVDKSHPSDEPIKMRAGGQYIRYSTVYRIGGVKSRRKKQASETKERNSGNNSARKDKITQKPWGTTTTNTDTVTEDNVEFDDPTITRLANCSGVGYGGQHAADASSTSNFNSPSQQAMEEQELEVVPVEDLVAAAVCVVEEEAFHAVLSECLTTLVKRDIVRPRSAGSSSSSSRVRAFRCGTYQPSCADCAGSVGTTAGGFGSPCRCRKTAVAETSPSHTLFTTMTATAAAAAATALTVGGRDGAAAANVTSPMTMHTMSPEHQHHHHQQAHHNTCTTVKATPTRPSSAPCTTRTPITFRHHGTRAGNSTNNGDNHNKNNHTPTTAAARRSGSFSIISYPVVRPPKSMDPQYLHKAPPITMASLLKAQNNIRSSNNNNSNNSISGHSSYNNSQQKSPEAHSGGGVYYQNKDRAPVTHIKRLLLELQDRVSTHRKNDEINAMKNDYYAKIATQRIAAGLPPDYSDDDVDDDDSGSGGDGKEKGAKSKRKASTVEVARRINWNAVYTRS